MPHQWLVKVMNKHWAMQQWYILGVNASFISACAALTSNVANNTVCVASLTALKHIIKCQGHGRYT